MKDNIQSLIFLDIDGPISTDKNKEIQFNLGRSTSSYNILLPRGPILNLKGIVDNIPNCNIILSSNWRLNPDTRLVEEPLYNIIPSPARINLERQLNSFGIYISDETPYFNKNRSMEIGLYLEGFRQRYNYIPPYIIIDNEISDLKLLYKGHIVYCSNENGLTKEGVNISINLLRKFRAEVLISKGIYI